MTRPTANNATVRSPEHFLVQQDTSGLPLRKQLLFNDTILIELIDLAVAQNPDVLIARQRIEIARSYLKLRKGAMLPTVDINAAASGTKYGDYTMEGVGNFDTNLSGNITGDQKAPVPITPDFFVGFRSTWEIDLWGKLKQQKRSAYLRLLASEEGRQLIITSLVSEVAIRYYELLALDAEIAVIKKNIALQDSAVSIAEIQKEAGRTTELGVLQFEAQLLRTRSLLTKTEQDIIRVENEINQLVGRLPQRIKRSRNFAAADVPSFYIEGVPAELLTRRPDIRQAELELNANNAEVAAAKAALLPALTISPFAGYHSFNSTLLFNPGSLAYGIIGGLTGPLLNRSSITSNISRSEAEKQQSLYQYNNTLLGAFREVETALSNLQNLNKMYELNRQEADVLANAVNTSNELYKVGYASYLEVITAQRNAVEAEINALETKKNIYHSHINLYRSIGGGW